MSEYVFLSPEWVHEVARVVESSKKADPYFRQLVGNFTLNVFYKIHGIPMGLRTSYVGAAAATVLVQLHKGEVRTIKLGHDSGQDRKIHLRVTMDYSIAKGLFLGESSVAAILLNNKIKAQPVDGFRQWPQIAAKSLVTARRVLKAARQVPTAFHGNNVYTS